MRSPRKTASSIEWVTKKTVAWVVRQSSSKRSCMVIRVIGSSAPNGSSMRMIRGCRIKVLRDGDPLAHAAGELVGVLVAGRVATSSPTRSIQRPCDARSALAAVRPGIRGRRRRCRARCGDRSWCSPERPCRGRRRVRSRAAPSRAPRRWWAGCCGRQAGDQPQDRALAAAAGSEDADELALVDQVFNDERHVADRGEFVGAAGIDTSW